MLLLLKLNFKRNVLGYDRMLDSEKNSIQSSLFYFYKLDIYSKKRALSSAITRYPLFPRANSHFQ